MHPGYYKDPSPAQEWYLDKMNRERAQKEKPKMKIYIAGPMRGYPSHNFPAFYDMEAWLRAKGYETLNPARADDETGVPPGSIGLADALTRDAAMVASADAIYMLAGWENSAGAMVEWTLAKALGLQIFYQAGIEDYEWVAAMEADAAELIQ